MFNFHENIISIDDALSNFKKVILFGASSSGINALKILKNLNIDILCFCDNDKNKQGMLIEGIKIHKPENILKIKYDAILVTSDFFIEISSQLKNMGLKNYYYFGFCFDFNRWKSHFDCRILNKNKNRIKYAYNLLEDQESKIIFETIINFRYTMGSSGGRQSKFIEYFHPKSRPIQQDTIIDGGAWTGDTAHFFFETLSGNCKIYCFEPNHENYKILSENIINNHEAHSVFPIKMGLWSEDSELKFDDSHKNSMSFCISEYGLSKIKVTSIDNFSSNNNLHIDIIKMDIEGSEKNALLGSRETIQKFKPKLYICSYHEPDDLWEIPITIKELNPRYRLYLGNHSQSIFETIVYACN